MVVWIVYYFLVYYSILPILPITRLGEEDTPVKSSIVYNQVKR